MNRIINEIQYRIIKEFIKILISIIGFMRRHSDDIAKRKIDTIVNDVFIKNFKPRV